MYFCISLLILSFGTFCMEQTNRILEKYYKTSILPQNNFQDYHNYEWPLNLPEVFKIHEDNIQKIEKWHTDKCIKEKTYYQITLKRTRDKRSIKSHYILTTCEHAKKSGNRVYKVGLYTDKYTGKSLPHEKPLHLMTLDQQLTSHFFNRMSQLHEQGRFR